jgi:hypothetical protein
MGLYNPNVFIVAGETDCFGPAHSTECAVDSRLRKFVSFAASATYRGAVGSLARDPRIASYYAEFMPDGDSTAVNSRYRPGVVPLSNTPMAYSVANSTGTLAYMPNGQVAGGTGAAGGLTYANTDRMGVKIYMVGNNAFVQFYVNGVAAIAAEATTAEPHYLKTTIAEPLFNCVMFVDRDELLYLPADCQPWGASAMVSDSGGYSPEASKITAIAGSTTIDSFGRAITGATINRGARVDLSRIGTDHLIAFECEIEVMPTAGQAIAFGLVTAAAGLTSTPGSIANCVGFYWTTGLQASKRYNGAAATNLSIGTGPWALGDRLTLWWNPANGRVWAGRNGFAFEGNPQAGTGQSFTISTSIEVFPFVQTSTNGRIRIFLHKKEMRYAGDYTEGFEKTEVLPQRHFKGSLISNTEVTQEVFFEYPWGNSTRGTPIGAIELVNTDGYYDRISDYIIRDEDLSICEYTETGSFEYIAKGNIETADGESLAALKILVRGKDSVLDTFCVDGYALGRVELIPVYIEGNTADKFNVTKKQALNTYGSTNYYDKGISVNGSSAVSTSGDWFGFTRSVGSVGADHRVSVTMNSGGAFVQAVPSLINFCMQDADIARFKNSVSSGVGQVAGFYFERPTLYRQILGDLLKSTAAGYFLENNGSLTLIDMPSLAAASTFTIAQNDTYGEKRKTTDYAAKLTNQYSVFTVQKTLG